MNNLTDMTSEHSNLAKEFIKTLDSVLQINVSTPP